VPLAFQSGREADHSPLSSAEVKELVELYLHSPNMPSWRGAQGEHRDNFYVSFLPFLKMLGFTDLLCFRDGVKPDTKITQQPWCRVLSEKLTVAQLMK
jgi:hypothetical protein